jgi:CHAT domain-containing protein
MKRGNFDVFHYVGYGELENDRDQLALAGDNERDLLDATDFCRVLRGQPRLVVLQLCETEAEELPPDLSTFAHALLAHGVEVVVGFQYPMRERLGAEFVKELYEELAENVPVELAVQSARASLIASGVNHAFLSPAVFVTRLGGTLLVPDRPWQAEVPSQATVTTSNVPVLRAVMG